MAIFDALLEFSDNQDMSQTTGVYAATNVLDMQASGLEMGAGEPMYLNVRVGTEAIAAVDGATTGACTLVVALRSDTDATIDTNSIVNIQTVAFDETQMTAGAWLLRVSLPVTFDENRYVGLTYTLAGATSAVGKIDAWVDNGPQSSYDTQVAESNI
jgi:hypothetical protein